jgi:hypothetical protein
MQPPASSRAFPFQPVRSGPHVRFHTTLTCSRCERAKTFESARKLPDEVITRKFREWGWLLGRNRAYDICAKCLQIKPENVLARKFTVTRDGQPVPTCAEVVEEAERARETDRIKINAVLDKHLPHHAPEPVQKESTGAASESPPSSVATAQNGLPARDGTMDDPRLDQLLQYARETREIAERNRAMITDARAAQELIIEANLGLADSLRRLIETERDILGNQSKITERLDAMTTSLGHRQEVIGLGIDGLSKIIQSMNCPAPPPKINLASRRVPNADALDSIDPTHQSDELPAFLRAPVPTMAGDKPKAKATPRKTSAKTGKAAPESPQPEPARPRGRRRLSFEG